MKTAFVFSGQGAQYDGMGLELYENNTRVREIFEEASDRLHVDMKQVCFQDDPKLHFTPYTQPAILTLSHAIEELIKAEGFVPDVVGGLSLGEYTALVSSQALTFQEAVTLVHKRGTFMEEAVPNGKGKMAAVIGLEASQVEEICADVSKEIYVDIANYNTPSQLVISGEASGVEKASLKAEDAGAKRVVELNVSGPFHSHMLKPAAELFKKELEQASINEPKYPVYSNVTAQVYPNKEAIIDLLTQQIYSPVRFEQMITQMIADGVDTFIEIGPGKTLRSFIKSIDRTVTVKNVEKESQFKKVIELLNK
ncbi:ACP S-malonyltransferase [Alkalibacterium iburiense]|uniref:Malonyl CoA-acyl carrier protein transacylase n=1 Tax=Alkalibacterium iburiense TaxID=290589 RepID=A0ABN0X8B9_9LACT